MPYSKGEIPTTHHSFSTETECYPRSIAHCMKESGGRTAYCLRKNGIMHRGNAHCPQEKCGGGKRNEITDPIPFPASQLEALRQILMFGSHYMMMTRNV